MKADRNGKLIGRRPFLQAATAGLASLALPGCSAAVSTTTHSCAEPEPIGLQLYTVRDALEGDFEATLARVADIGFRDVEFAGYFGYPAADTRKLLDGLNLVSSAGHVSLSAFDESNISKVIADARAIGHRYLVVSAIDPRSGLGGYRRAVDVFNRTASVLADEGLCIAYHNHAFDFEHSGDIVPFDLLLEGTDPGSLVIELDVYWITVAGLDPLDYFARWPGRFRLVHAKDSGGPPEHEMTEVGAGVIDWQRIFANRKQAGIERIYVEHDNPVDAFASIAESYSYLRSLNLNTE